MKQVQDKQKCDKIKQKVKKLLIQIDSDKTGAVKMEVMSQILALHKITLSANSLQKLKR